MNGIPDRGVPACLSCHGNDVAGRLPLVARLHGQYQGYIESRLRGAGH